MFYAHACRILDEVAAAEEAIGKLPFSPHELPQQS